MHARAFSAFILPALRNPRVTTNLVPSTNGISTHGYGTYASTPAQIAGGVPFFVGGSNGDQGNGASRGIVSHSHRSVNDTFVHLAEDADPFCDLSSRSGAYVGKSYGSWIELSGSQHCEVQEGKSSSEQHTSNLISCGELVEEAPKGSQYRPLVSYAERNAPGFGEGVLECYKFSYWRE